MLSNPAENLQSSAKWKSKQAAKIWGLYLKKQRFSDTMQFPEGLENTPFNFANKSFLVPLCNFCLSFLLSHPDTIRIWLGTD